MTRHVNKKSLKIPKGVTRSRKSKKDRQHNGKLSCKKSKGVIRIRKSKDRQHNGKLSCKKSKGVIRIRKSKDRQHNGQKKRKKEQTTTYKTYTKH